MFSRSLLERNLSTFYLALLLGICSACGGGKSTPSPSDPTPPLPSADFNLQVVTTTVPAQQNGIAPEAEVKVTPTNGFTGTVTLTASGMPAGVSVVDIGVSKIPSGGSGYGGLEFAASNAAAVGSSTITLTATSGALTHTATFTLQVTPAAPFAIQLTPGSLSTVPNTRTWVTVAMTGAPSSQVSLSTTNVQSPYGFSVTCCRNVANSPTQFLVDVGAVAGAVANYPVQVVATDQANNTAVANFPVTINVPFHTSTALPRSTFAVTDQGVTGVAYDATRRNVYACVKALNEVVVFSAADGHKVASIPVQRPDEIDVATDGSAVYVVSTEFNGIVTIDPNSFQVMGHSNGPSGTKYAMFTQVAALANGKVLLGPTTGLLNNYPFMLWDPTADTYTGIGPRSLGSSSTQFARSADHAHVLIYGESSSVLYDAESNTFSGVANVGGFRCALNPNGTQFFCGSGQAAPNAFYDENFQLLAAQPFPRISLEAVQYSVDGTRLYALGDDDSGPANVAAFDTTTFALVGNAATPDFASHPSYSGTWIVGSAIDETGMMFGPATIGFSGPGSYSGMAFVDVSSPGAIQLPPFSWSVLGPSAANLGSPTSVKLTGVGFQEDAGATFKAFVGAAPASPNSLLASGVTAKSDGELDFTIPSSTVPGPANVTVVRSDGYSQVQPNGVSFGPTVYAIDPNGGSLAGGDQVKSMGSVSTRQTSVWRSAERRHRGFRTRLSTRNRRSW